MPKEKHLVKIPKVVKVGGFTYRVEVSGEMDKDLESRSLYGDCSGHRRRIGLWSHQTGQEMSQTFLHECLHTIVSVYCANRLEEDHIRGMAHGLHQILEQLGVRFVK